MRWSAPYQRTKPPMHALLAPLSFLALTAAGFAQDAPQQEPTQPPKAEAKPAAEKPAPKTLELGQRVNGGLTLLDIDGKEQKAMDLMGKVTVVNFYSIQCPVQAQWDERLAQIQKDFAEQGVVFLHIDSNVTEIGEKAPEQPKADDPEAKKPYENVRAHLAEKGLPFRVLVDHGNKVADLFAATSTPHVYVFGVDGKLVYKGLVDDDQRDNKPDTRTNYLRDVLGKLTKGETVEPSSTREVGCSIKRVGGNNRGGGRRPRGEGRRRGEGGGQGPRPQGGGERGGN